LRRLLLVVPPATKVWLNAFLSGRGGFIAVSLLYFAGHFGRRADNGRGKPNAIDYVGTL
jgi:hypothetical protein